MARKAKTIYQIFDKYTEEEINEAMKLLKPHLQKVIQDRFNNDILSTDNLNPNKSIMTMFYCRAIPSLKEKLIELTGEDRYKDEMNNTETNKNHTSKKEVSFSKEQSSNQEINEISLEDMKKIKAFFETDLFKNHTNNLGYKEKSIISLRFGFIDGKFFSTKAIADFLEYSEEEINSIVENVLNNIIISINDNLDTILKLKQK